MSLSHHDARAHQTFRRVHRRRGEDGFTMILALGILLVTSLLLAGVFAAVQGDASLSRSDLDGKRAYSAAQAGVQDYLGQLNENAASSSWWQNCANDSASNVSVAGTTGETYSYQPVTACVTGGAVGTVVNPTLGAPAHGVHRPGGEVWRPTHDCRRLPAVESPLLHVVHSARNIGSPARQHRLPRLLLLQ